MKTLGIAMDSFEGKTAILEFMKTTGAGDRRIPLKDLQILESDYIFTNIKGSIIIVPKTRLVSLMIRDSKDDDKLEKF